MDKKLHTFQQLVASRAKGADWTEMLAFRKKHKLPSVPLTPQGEGLFLAGDRAISVSRQVWFYITTEGSVGVTHAPGKLVCQEEASIFASAMVEINVGQGVLDRDVPHACDQPDMDGTDFAHDAWWRGYEKGLTDAAERIQAALEDKHGTWAVGNATLENTVQLVIKLRARLSKVAKSLLRKAKG